MNTFNITKTDQPIIFTIGNEDFEAIPAEKLSANVIARYFQEINEGNLFKAHEEFFQAVLTLESYERFNTRLNFKKDPITIFTLGDITSWLIGEEFLGGKSWGRSQVIISFALDSWDEFDSWCLIHGIKEDPWKLPSYRFGALVVAYLKDDKMPEGLVEIDNALSNADSSPHPFFDPSFRRTLKAMGGILSASSYTPTSTTIDNVVYDSRLTDLPVEERKRQEAATAGKAFRVPEWWRGERANYKIAKSMMGTLPKKIGPVK